MPDSIRTAATGFMPKVIGSRIEIADSTPMPGRTPTTLPTRTPTKHQSRLLGSSAISKPWRRSRKPVSISAKPHDRNFHMQQVDEEQDREDRHAGGEQQRTLQGRGAVAERGDQHGREAGRQEAGVFSEQDEGDRREDDAGPA